MIYYLDIKGFGLLYVLVTIALVLIVGLGWYFENNQLQTSLSPQIKKASQQDKNNPKPTGDRSLEYFIRDNLVQFPKFQSQVTPNQIKRIFPISLNYSVRGRNQGWIAEVEKG